mmetsp:Transcript_24492/g.55765  ORF Transcript_24492/g.55765 Transcript_24492/m.55765 type:complete len:201 (-) Transcript_24492:17-619(-)
MASAEHFVRHGYVGVHAAPPPVNSGPPIVAIPAEIPIAGNRVAPERVVCSNAPHGARHVGGGCRCDDEAPIMKNSRFPFVRTGRSVCSRYTLLVYVPLKADCVKVVTLPEHAARSRHITAAIMVLCHGHVGLTPTFTDLELIDLVIRTTSKDPPSVNNQIAIVATGPALCWLLCIGLVRMSTCAYPVHVGTFISPRNATP